MWKQLTLKNVAIISILLILIGFSPKFYPLYPSNELFWFILVIGGFGFALAYFFYAVDHWGIRNKVLAIGMLTIPILMLLFSIIKIPETANIIVYITFAVISSVTISAVLLFSGNKIKWKIRPYFVKFKSGNHRLSLPESSYALLGIFFISLLIFSTTTSSAFSDNVNVISRSITLSIQNTQNIPAPQTYESGLITKPFKYIFRGNSNTINANLYSGIYDKVSSTPQPVACYRYNDNTSPCNNEEIQQYYLKYLDEPIQKKNLAEFVDLIKARTQNQDDQARIAISLVQNIPYDHSKATPLFFQTGISRYPYLVLFENAGICEEKSLLLAYLLRELGYGVVLFEFKSENHMAIGIKSPAQYSYLNSGYAFIETTTPSIPTDSQGDYGGAGKLTSNPQIFPVSDGNSFTSISEEYQDAQILNQIRNMGTVLDEYHYSQWTSLEQKYGINA
jgi:hypothetical protein